MRSHRWRTAAATALILLAAAVLPAGAMAARGEGQQLPPEPTEPQISIVWPPLAIMNWGIPSEHLHLKLNQPVTPATLPVNLCLPGVGYQAVLPWFHYVWKPDGPGLDLATLTRILGLSRKSDVKDFIGDALSGFGTVGVPLPRDQLGDYELEVFCIEIAAELPPRLGRTSTAYSVEPYPYRSYVLSPGGEDTLPYEQGDADHGGPVSYWRLGDLPKGSRVLADSVGGHDGTYYADGGAHPALDRDGAPNCNVFERATSGCNDGTVRTSSTVTRSFTASVADDTFTIAGGNPWSNGDTVRLSGVTGITGVQSGTEAEGPFYIVRDATSTTFRLAASNQGAAIDLGGADGTGTASADSYNAVNSGILSGVLSDDDRAVFFTPGQYAAVQDYPAAEFATDSGYTIETWVNPRVVADMGFFQHGYGPALRIEDGRFVFRQTDTDVVQTSGDLPAAGEWFHVVGTWDGASTAKLYVNGKLVGSSTDAGKAPSGGGSTLYIGRDEISPETFNGAMDEVAYYTEPLSHDAIALHHEIATYVPPAQSIINPLEYYLDVTRPKVEMKVPTEGAVFNRGKDVAIDFVKSDPDGLLLDGKLGGDIVGCLPPDGGGLDTATAGDKTLTVVCTDRGLNVKSVTVRYRVADFADVVLNDDPVGYWRLGDDADSGVMEGEGALPSGEYKNDTAGGPIGVSGDADTTRRFLGQGGYGYVNDLAHPRWSYTMEAWVKLADSGDAMILQHGRGGALFVKDGRIVFRQTVTDVTSGTLASSLVGGWHQVVGTWDGVFARLFIDGVQEGDEVYAPTPPSGFSTFYVGYGEYAPWIRGDMDEVSYYGSALSPERVRQHYLADPPAPPGAVSAGGTAGAGSSATGSSGTGTSATTPATAEPRSAPAQPRTRIIRSGRARVSGTAPRLVVTLPLVGRCPATTRSCTAIAALTRSFGDRALAGSTRRTLQRGEAWRVQVRLTARASRLLRAAGTLRVRASVKVRSAGAAPSARVVQLTLRAP